MFGYLHPIAVRVTGDGFEFSPGGAGEIGSDGEAGTEGETEAGGGKGFHGGEPTMASVPRQ